MGKKKKKKKKQNIPQNARTDAGERAQSNSIYIHGDNNTIQNVQQGNVQISNSTQTIPDTKKIREKLKDAYKNLRLPMVSWMQRGSGNFLVGHHFIQLQLHEGNETSTTKHGEEIELRNIFEGRTPDGTTDSRIVLGDFERPRPNRILIESQPGFGKTTLAHKIIHDWAEDKEYTCHFDLAILITLRSLKTKTTTKSIQDVVREKTETVTSDGCNQWEMINNDKTLLVLDGLDEVDDQCKENVLKILYDTVVYKMVIVVTCRTGLFNLDEEFVDCVHGGAKKGNKFWDKKIRIVGITTENRVKFLSTFLEEEKKQQHLDRVENIINQFSGSSHSDYDSSEDDYSDESSVAFDSEEDNETHEDNSVDEEEEASKDYSTAESVATEETVDKLYYTKDSKGEIEDLTESDEIKIKTKQSSIVDEDDETHEDGPVDEEERVNNECCQAEPVTITEETGDEKFYAKEFSGEIELTESNVLELKKTPQGRDDSLNKMFKSPLFLILLVFVVERTSQATIKTKTDLFKNLVDCIIRRSAAKRQTFLKANFTIFVEHLNDSVSKEYLELFEKFGNMAMDRILNGDLHFECDSDTDQIYEMGVFIKHEQRDKFESLQHYECFHLSILEFAAAFSIWRNFLSNRKILKTSDRDKMNVVCRKKGATSLVIPFLFGLMGKDGKELFSQLSDYNLIYNTEKALMELVFTECDMDDVWRDVVTNFVPSELKFHNVSLFVISPVLNKCLVKLCMSSRNVRHLSHSLGIKFLELEVDTWENLNPNVIDRVKCEHLLLRFSSSLQFYDDSNLENLKKIVSISAQSREVFVSNDVHRDVLHLVNSQIFDNVVLDVLEVDVSKFYGFHVGFGIVSNSEFTQQLIASITEHVTANHLSVLFNDGAEADVIEYCSSVICNSSNIRSISLLNGDCVDYRMNLDLISVICNSSNIRTISLVNGDCVENGINFDLITDNGRKKWTSLILNNFYVKRPLDHSYCIDIENFYVSMCYSGGLELVAPRQLGCTDELLRSVASDSHWRGWESVVELTLIFDEQFVLTKIPNLSYLRRFNRLKSVTLYVRRVDTLFSTSLVDIGRELNYTRKIRIFITIHFDRQLVTLLEYIIDVIKNEEFNSSQRIVLLIDFSDDDRYAHWDITESLNFITATAPNIRFKFFFVKKMCIDLYLAQNSIDYSACSVAYNIYPLCSRWRYLNYYFCVNDHNPEREHTVRVLSVRKR